MELIRENLFLSEYWSETSSSDWSAIDYFIKLIEKIPDTDKRTGHQKIDSDLNDLYVMYIDDPSTKKKISSILNYLKKPSKAATDTINTFWKTHSRDLRASSMENKVTENNLDNTLKRKAKTSLSEAIQNLEPSTSVQNSKSRKRIPGPPEGESSTKRRQEPKNKAVEQETDGVYVNGNDHSIGTIIKNNAITLHNKLLRGSKISSRQRTIITNGLSSILDLSDDSFKSQRSLFSDSDWVSIKKYFDNVLELLPANLNERITDNIIIIYNTLSLSNDIKCCVRLARREAELATTEVASIGLEILRTYLQAMHRYPYMLTKPFTKKVTENDFFRCIWSPVFEVLFPPEDCLIRIKSGDLINPSTTNKKQMNYIENKSVKGFKIDFRLLVDQHDNTETDIGIGECALEDDDDKAISDEGKLTREGKDSLDDIIKIIPEDIGSNTVWIIQIVASHCSLSTIHLESSGLYIIMHRYSFNIPFSEKCLKDCGESIQWLLKMREHFLELRHSIIKHTSNKSSNNISFNRRGSQQINPRFSFMRDTYYTPPRNTVSKLPLFMFGPPTVITFTNRDKYNTNNTQNEFSFKDEADVYGYRTLSDGRYYNIYTKNISETHPLKTTSRI